MSGLAHIDHFIVLMLENRSFDSMAGWLYDPANRPPFRRAPRGQPFDGLSGKRLGNMLPAGAVGPTPRWVPVGRAPAADTPNPGPAEGYADVNLELYGHLRPPLNLPAPLPPVAPMSGFARAYVRHLRQNGAPTDPAHYSQVMDGFTPAMVPVISTLANAYAVCDRWFCPVPAETWANRSFALAATSSGFVDNTPYAKWLRNDADTLLNRISAAGADRPRPDWHVYFDRRNILPLAWLQFPRLFWRLFTNYSYFEAFYRDARRGRLPSFAWLEPSMLRGRRNDEHPPEAVTAGEALIRSVYLAVRDSPAWNRTLLIVTYDEHGGLYDHVPPPAANPPHRGGRAGEYGFRFDRLGPRVCTVLISPWIEAGTVFRPRGADGREAAADHTSIIRTVCARFGLPPLTARDAAAPDVGAVLTRTRPRTDRPAIPQPAG